MCPFCSTINQRDSCQSVALRLSHLAPRGKAQRSSAAPEPSVTPLRNSIDLGADPAAAWLISQGTPTSEAPRQEYPGEVDGSQQHMEMEGVVASHAPRRQHLVLSEGSLVCFYRDGHLLVAKQAGSHWSLQPVPWGYHRGNDCQFANNVSGWCHGGEA